MKFGDQIDRFGILKKISAGGMGTVYLGFDPVYEEVVALKVLFEAYADDPLYIRRFQREIAVLGQLNHPNIVRLIDSGMTGDLRYMVLEYVRGKSLVEVLEEQKKLPQDIGLRLMKEVGRALSFAHSKHVIHRDIKPDNVMVMENTWSAKILDFGVAFAQDDLVRTGTGHFVGTLNYAPPEQVKGEDFDERADLYSFGLLCYEMLTGRNAIEGVTQESVLNQQLAEAYIPPNQLEPSIPQALSSIILKLLRADPAMRYSSADAVLADIALFEGRTGSVQRSAVSIYSQPEYLRDFERAQSALETKDLELAFQLGQQLIRDSPQSAEAHFLVGRTNVLRGCAYNAIQDFVKATALDSTNACYRLSLATTYQTLGMISQARSEYQVALQIDPTDTIAREGLDALASLPDFQPIPVLMSGTNPLTNEVLPPPVVPAAPPPPSVVMASPEEYPSNPMMRRRPLALKTILWWGWGFSALGARDRMHQASMLQGLSIVAAALLTALPQFIHQPAPSAHAVAAAHFPELTAMLKMIGWFYFLGTFLHIVELLNYCQLYDLAGRVIGHRPANRWVTLNLGRNRGVKLTSVFNVYRASSAAHRGIFLGRVLVQELGNASCSGTFLQDAKNVPQPGDMAVAYEAVRIGVGSPVPSTAAAVLKAPAALSQAVSTLNQS